MLSVVLPYRNAASTLHQAARSVLADMADGDELLLIDDRSEDDGPELAAALGSDDRRVRLLSTSGAASGIAGALMHGIAHARGAFIARMDADDVSLPGRLGAERALLASDPSLGAVATRIEVFGDEARDGIRRYVAWQNGVVTAAEHERAIFIEAPVCHPSTMIRRSALDAIGGYRGEVAEDYDLWLRLVGGGWGIAKVPQVLFRWRIHGQSATWTDPRFSLGALRRLRARHLVQRLGPRPFGIWGAGDAGTRLSRELGALGARSSFFIDIDPRKIGRTRHGAPIVEVDAGLARARASGALVVVAVAAMGARDLVRGRLDARGFVEGEDYVCAT